MEDVCGTRVQRGPLFVLSDSPKPYLVQGKSWRRRRGRRGASGCAEREGRKGEREGVERKGLILVSR